VKARRKRGGRGRFEKHAGAWAAMKLPVDFPAPFSYLIGLQFVAVRALCGKADG